MRFVHHPDDSIMDPDFERYATSRTRYYLPRLFVSIDSLDDASIASRLGRVTNQAPSEQDIYAFPNFSRAASSPH